MKEIKQEIDEIEGKLKTCAKQIASRQAEIADLKAKNAELVEMNLDKERRPASLLVQRKRIADLADQIEEFKFLQRNLEQSLEFSQEKLVENSYQSKINEYLKAEALQLASMEKVKNLFAELLDAIKQVEASQRGHCLERLSQLVAAIGTEKLESFGINLTEVISKFNQAKLPDVFDLGNIQHINLTTQNLLLQLDAISQGKRSFHKAKVTPAPQKIRTVQPITTARQLEEHRISDLAALQRYKAGRQQVHHRPHK